MNIQGEFDNWLANQDTFWEFLLKSTKYIKKREMFS